MRPLLTIAPLNGALALIQGMDTLTQKQKTPFIRGLDNGADIACLNVITSRGSI